MFMLFLSPPNSPASDFLIYQNKNNPLTHKATNATSQSLENSHILHSNRLLRLFTLHCRTRCSLFHIYMYVLYSPPNFMALFQSSSGFQKEIRHSGILELQWKGHLVVSSALLRVAHKPWSWADQVLDVCLNSLCVKYPYRRHDHKCPQSLKELILEFNAEAVSLHESSDNNFCFLKNRTLLGMSGCVVLTQSPLVNIVW